MAKNLNTIVAALNTNAAAAAAPKKTRKPRAAKTEAVAPLTMEHTMTVDAEPTLSAAVSATDDLDKLLADIGMFVPDDEVIVAAPAGEPVVIEASLPMTPAVDELEAAVSGAETAELMSAAAAEEGGDGSAPSGTASELVSEPGAAAATKKTPTPRVRYTDKVERLKARVGDKLGEYSVLTTADVPMDDAALGEVMERTMDIIRAMNKKVGNRGVNFIEWLSGKKASLNNVIERTLKLLQADGHLETGEQGNVMKNLLARPYSLASARAMGGNTIAMLVQLKLIVPMEGAKGKFVANPDSLLLASALTRLSAPTTASAEPDAEGADEGDAE